MKPLTKSRIIVDIYNGEIIEVYDYKAQISSYHAVEFLTDTTLKVCLIQADLFQDARNSAILFKSKCKDKDDIILIDYDKWEVDYDRYQSFDTPDNYCDDNCTIGEFYDWLHNLPVIGEVRYIVYGSHVKHLFGYFLTILGNYETDMHTEQFLKQNGIVILNYYTNFLTRIYHWLTCDRYEAMMRDMIELGENTDLLQAEQAMDRKQSKR